MQITDLTVEVRNKSLARVGMIRREDLILDVHDAFNNVGTWTITLPTDHLLAGPLATPGAGVIISTPSDVLMSGPMVSAQTEVKTDDPTGTTTFSGVSDTVILSDMLSFPDPTNVNPTTQTLAHDDRTGAAETVMHAYVNANCGPSAPAARRKAGLTMGVNLGRGGTIKKSARFPVLGTLLEEIALPAGLRFRIVQRGSGLVFETYATVDRSPYVRFSVLNGNVSSQKVAITAPGVTQVIIAGQGDLTARTFVLGNDADSLAAEAEWGRRIESFVDQRQTDDPDVYSQKISEVLAASGFTGVNVQAVPVDDEALRYGVDWNLGDTIALVVRGYEYKSSVTGLVLKADNSGVRLGAELGDPAEFDTSMSTAGRITDAEKRISYLERAV